MAETLKLNVITVIGTGDPTDGIMLIPLLHDWHVPKNCAHGALTGEECEKPLRRIYILDEPLLQGHKAIGMCEEHHQLLANAD